MSVVNFDNPAGGVWADSEMSKIAIKSMVEVQGGRGAGTFAGAEGDFTGNLDLWNSPALIRGYFFCILAQL